MQLHLSPRNLRLTAAIHQYAAEKILHLEDLAEEIMAAHVVLINDDAARAIQLYCDLIAKAAIDGIARQQGALGVDIGASAEAPVEPALDETPAAGAPEA